MSRADSEATAWLDKMMGPDAELHREAFDEWLAKPGNAKAYDEARDNWPMFGPMLGSVNPAGGDGLLPQSSLR